MAKPVVLVGQPLLAPVLPLLRASYDVMALWEQPGDAALARVEAVVWAGEFALHRTLLDRMPALRLIACFTVGYDGVDLSLVRDRGIMVAHGGSANAEDVADHAIGLMIAHRRWIVEGDRHLREGRWTIETKTRTRSMRSARLGIVGMGAIGVAVAARAEAMKMDVRWWAPRPKPNLAWPRTDSLIALAKESDILVIAARADENNRGLIDATVLDALGPQGLLVNVARGQLVDEDALVEALKAGRLGGAALDVFDPEPTDAAKWRDVPNVVLTPHTGGATHEAVAQMAETMMGNLAAHFAGLPLPSPVPEMLR